MSDRSRNPLPPDSNTHEVSNSQRSLWQSASQLFSATTVASLLGLFSFALTARTLGVSEFGALVLVFTFANAASRLFAFQSWQAIIRFVSQHAEAGDSSRVAATFRVGYLVDLLTALAAAALTYASAEWFGELFNWQERVTSGVELYALAVLFTIDGAPTAVLRYYDQFGRIALYHVASAMTKLLLVVFTIYYSPTFSNILLVWIVSHVIGYLLLNFLAWNSLRRRSIKLLTTNAGVRSVMSRPLARHLLMSNIESSLRVLRELDVQVVALLADEAAAGLLRVARQLANFAGRVVDAFYEAVYPKLAKLSASSNWQALRQTALWVSLQTGVLALVGGILFALFGEFLLFRIFGEEYVSAYQPTCILLAAMTVWGFAQPFSPALMSIGAVGTLLRNHCLAAAGYLLLLYFLVPLYSYTGAAWAMLGLYTLWGVATYLSFHKLIPSFAEKPEPLS